MSVIKLHHRFKAIIGMSFVQNNRKCSSLLLLLFFITPALYLWVRLIKNSLWRLNETTASCPPAVLLSEPLALSLCLLCGSLVF